MSGSGQGSQAGALVGTVTTWFWHLALLTATWWLQVIAGGVLLGVAPATIVLYEQIRHGLDGDFPGARWAWRRWRSIFREAQARLLLPILTVPVLVFYILMLRGHVLSISLAVLTLIFCGWLALLPAVAAAHRLPGIDPDGGPLTPRSDEPQAPPTPASLWLLTARVIVRSPAILGLAWGASIAGLLALYLTVPLALVLAIPAIPALLATIGSRRAVGPAMEGPTAQQP